MRAPGFLLATAVCAAILVTLSSGLSAHDGKCPAYRQKCCPDVPNRNSRSVSAQVGEKLKCSDSKLHENCCPSQKAGGHCSKVQKQCCPVMSTIKEMTQKRDVKCTMEEIHECCTPMMLKQRSMQLSKISVCLSDLMKHLAEFNIKVPKSCCEVPIVGEICKILPTDRRMLIEGHSDSDDDDE